MNDETPLFRPAAIEAKRPSAVGEIILVQPVPFALFSLLAVIVGGVIVGLFIWGTYTRHTTLAGKLVPELGVVRVHTRQYGTVVEKHVDEGDAVETGDALYIVSSERLSSELGATRELIGAEVDKKLNSLQEQIEKLRELERTERESLEQMAAALSSESEHLGGMKESQAARVELAAQAAARYEQLRRDGFVSEEHLIAKRETLLEQRSRLQQLERESSNVARQLAELRSRIAGLPLEYANRTAELERAVAGTRQELTRNEAERRITVTAPAAGIATAARGEVGQFVDGNRPLVTIVPHESKLRAKLYAPSRAVGLLDVGDTVQLRYEAYPYEKFGHHEGAVAAISRAAVPVAAAAAGAGGQGRPMYEVTVELGAQRVTAYGEERPLRAGMTVRADVLQETRRLYEWVLEPLYALTGRIH